MMRIAIVAAAAVLVAGCGNSTNEKAQAGAGATALQPGEYALTWTETETGPPANKTPASAPDNPASDPSAFAERACIGADGAIEPAAFGDKGDQCHTVNSYIRNGILNVQAGCEREGKGSVSHIASGTFTAADSFAATVETSSTDGKSTMTRKLAARRVGECTADAGKSTES